MCNVQPNPHRNYIVVCGNINYDTVSGFLSDFFNPARDDVNVEAVFLNKLEPDLEFEGLIKRDPRVQYFQVGKISRFRVTNLFSCPASAILTSLLSIVKKC